MANRPPTNPRADAGRRGPTTDGLGRRGLGDRPGRSKDKPRAYSREAYEAELDALETRIGKLKTAYERFFMGLDKVPPATEREALERDLRNSVLHRVRRVEHRWRFQNLTMRMATYKGYWDRIMRRIEEGTFRRDRTQQLPTPEPMLPPPPPAEAPETLGSDPGRELYETWIAARDALGKGETRTPYEQFRSQLEKLRAQQIAKYGCADVAYRVSVQDGKVQIAAKPLFKTPEPA